jgi:hypothetical protein
VVSRPESRGMAGRSVERRLGGREGIGVVARRQAG